MKHNSRVVAGAIIIAAAAVVITLTVLLWPPIQVQVVGGRLELVAFTDRGATTAPGATTSPEFVPSTTASPGALSSPSPSSPTPVVQDGTDTVATPTLELTPGNEPARYPAIGPSNAEVLSPVLTLNADQPTDLAFSPQGNMLVIAQRDGSVSIWPTYALRDEHPERHFAGMFPLRIPVHEQWIYQVAFSPDGDTLATASLDGTVKLLDVSRVLDVQGNDALLNPGPQLILTLQGEGGEVSGVAYSPDGATIATGSEDGALRLWNASTGALLRKIEAHTSRIWGVVYSSYGENLATASADKTVKIWDADSGRLVHVLRGHTSTVWKVAYSPDGTTLASSSWDGTVRLWHPFFGDELAVLQGNSGWVYGIEFSPDGWLLAASTSEAATNIWDVQEALELRQESLTLGARLNVLAMHTARVWDVAFSPNGQMLATASDDGTVILWAQRP